MYVELVREFYKCFTETYQMDMLRNLRKVNVDYHTVGWYQSTYLHNHINKEFLENHRKYQEVNEESIVLVYGMYSSVAMVTSLSVVSCRSTTHDSRHPFPKSVPFDTNYS